MRDDAPSTLELVVFMPSALASMALFAWVLDQLGVPLARLSRAGVGPYRLEGFILCALGLPAVWVAAAITSFLIPLSHRSAHVCPCCKLPAQKGTRCCGFEVP